MWNINPNPSQMFPSGPQPQYAANPGYQMAPSQPSPLLPNPTANQQFCLRYIYKQLEQVYGHMNNADIAQILPYLDGDQKNIVKQIDECTKIEKVNQFQEQYLKDVRERCIRLKNKNESILIEMFNIKDKISRSLAPSIDRSIDNQEQFNIVHDKIRRARMEVSNKLNHIKNRRLFDEAFNKSKQQNKRRFTPINLALTQFKDATEVIDRQLIRQREQIRMLVKHLYDESI